MEEASTSLVQGWRLVRPWEAHREGLALQASLQSYGTGTARPVLQMRKWRPGEAGLQVAEPEPKPSPPASRLACPPLAP